MEAFSGIQKLRINKNRNAFVAAAAKSLQSYPTLCDAIDGSPSGSPIPGILQARTLEWVAVSFSNACMHAKLLQPCPTLCDPMDSSPPGSSVHRILQARILEWAAISFSKKCLQLYLNICTTTLKYFILCKSLKRIYFFRNLKV